MPKTNKHLKVQVVLDTTNRPVQTEQIKAKEEPVVKQAFLSESQVVQLPTYNTTPVPKKAESQGGLNLLSLF